MLEFSRLDLTHVTILAGLTCGSHVLCNFSTWEHVLACDAIEVVSEAGGAHPLSQVFVCRAHDIEQKSTVMSWLHITGS